MTTEELNQLSQLFWRWCTHLKLEYYEKKKWTPEEIGHLIDQKTDEVNGFCIVGDHLKEQIYQMKF